MGQLHVGVGAESYDGGGDQKRDREPIAGETRRLAGQDEDAGSNHHPETDRHATKEAQTVRLILGSTNVRSAHPMVHTGHGAVVHIGHGCGWRVVTTPVLLSRVVITPVLRMGRRLNGVGRTVPTISLVFSMTLMGLVLASGVVGGGQSHCSISSLGSSYHSQSMSGVTTMDTSTLQAL